jgi:hypothetical protein
MTGEHPPPTCATTNDVPAEPELIAAKPASADGPVRWEFRLTADGRRILIEADSDVETGLA